MLHLLRLQVTLLGRLPMSTHMLVPIAYTWLVCLGAENNLKKLGSKSYCHCNLKKWGILLYKIRKWQVLQVKSLRLGPAFCNLS